MQNETQYSNENSGALFKNDRKELETHADYGGSINVEGKEYWLNGYLREAKSSGKKFFSLSVKPKVAKVVVPKVEGEIDKQIPF